jgi:hypothetical protein
VLHFKWNPYINTFRLLLVFQKASFVVIMYLEHFVKTENYIYFNSVAEKLYGGLELSFVDKLNSCYYVTLLTVFEFVCFSFTLPQQHWLWWQPVCCETSSIWSSIKIRLCCLIAFTQSSIPATITAGTWKQ